MANGGKDTIFIDVSLKLNKDDIVKQAQDAGRRAAKAFNDEFTKGTRGAAPAAGGAVTGGAGGGTRGGAGGGTGAGSAELSAIKQILSSFVQSLKQLQTAISGAAAQISVAGKPAGAAAGTTPGPAPKPPTGAAGGGAPGVAAGGGASYAEFLSKVEAFKQEASAVFPKATEKVRALEKALLGEMGDFSAAFSGLTKELRRKFLELKVESRSLGMGGAAAGAGGGAAGGGPPKPPPESGIKAKTKDLADLINKDIKLIDQSLDSRFRTFQEMQANLAEIRRAGGGGFARGKISTQIENGMKVLAELPTVMGENLGRDITIIKEQLYKAADLSKRAAGAKPGEQIDPSALINQLRDVRAAVRKSLPKAAGGAEQARLNDTVNKIMKGVAFEMQQALVKQAQAARDALRATQAKPGVSKSEILSAQREFQNRMQDVQDFFEDINRMPFVSPHVLKQGRFGTPQLAPGAQVLGAPELPGAFNADVRGALSALRDPKIADPSERAAKAYRLLSQDSENFTKNLQTAVGAAKDLRSASTEEREQLKASTGELERMLRARQAMQFRGVQRISIPRIAGEAPAATFARFNAEVEKLKRRLAETTSLGRGFRTQFSADIEFANGATKKLAGSLTRLGDTAAKVTAEYRELGQIATFGGQFRQAFRRVALWGTAAGVTYGVISAFRQAFQTMKEVETGVVELVKVMREAESDVDRFSKSVLSFAKTAAAEFGLSIKSIIDTMAIFGRQGKSTAEVMDLTRASSLAANVTVLNQAQAAEALTATIHQFNLDAKESISIIDKWNEVANRNAVTEAVLANAIKKTGAAAATVGITHEQLLGMVTAIGTATRQSGEQIGTSLRFIFQRSLRPETGNTLAKYGVSIRDASGNFRSFAEVLSEVAARWNEFSKSQQLAIAQAFGGARQYNAFLVLLRNYDLAIKAANDAIGAHGSAQKENARIMQTTQKQLAQARAEVDSLVTSFGGALLPIIKTSTSVLKSFIGFLESMPDSFKLAGAGALGLFGIFSRFSYAIDAMIPARAAGAAGVAGGGLFASLFAIPGVVLRRLTGAGKSIEELQSNFRKYGNLTETQKAFKQLGDHARITNRELGILGAEAVGIGAGLGAGTKNISKFNLAVKRVPVGTDKAVLGFRSMNSVLTMTALLGVRTGQGIAQGFVKMTNPLKRLLPSYRKLNVEQRAQNRANALLKASTLGTVSSFLVLGAAIGGIVIGLKLLGLAYDAIFGKSKKTGEQVKRELTAELAKREETYRVLRQNVSTIEDVNRRRRRAESFRGAPAGKVAEAVAEKSYISPILQEIRAAQAESRAGDIFLLSSPSLISNINEFGDAVLKSRDAMKDLTNAALESQAALISLLRARIAKAYGDDLQKAVKALRSSIASLNAIRPEVSTEAAIFGNVKAFAKTWRGMAEDVLKSKDKIQVAIDGMVRAMSDVPKETPLESFAHFLESGTISRALDYEARRMNSLFNLIGDDAISAGNLLNRTFIQVRTGLKLVRATGKLTEETFKEKLSTLPQDIQKYMKEGFRGGEIIVLPGGAPFGLDQVLVRINRSGEEIGEAITKNGVKWRGRLGDLFKAFTKEELGEIRIFDTRKIAAKARASILEAKRVIAGAGAGQIVFPTKLEFGVKFATDLGDVERLQRVLPNFISAVYLAQRQYIDQAADIQATAKRTPSGQIDEARLKVLEGFRVTAGFVTLMASFVSEIEKISNGVAKAVLKLEDSNIASRIEAQFAPIFGQAGAIKGVQVPKLQTFRETSADAIVSGLSPEFAITASSISKSLETVKETLVAQTKLGSRDLDRMWKDFSAQEVLRAKEISRGLKGDLGTGLVVTWLSKIYNLWKRSPLIAGVVKEVKDASGLATDFTAGLKSSFRLFSAGMGVGDPAQFLGGAGRRSSQVTKNLVDSLFAEIRSGSLATAKSATVSTDHLSKVYEVISDVFSDAIKTNSTRISQEGVRRIARAYLVFYDRVTSSFDAAKVEQAAFERAVRKGGGLYGGAKAAEQARKDSQKFLDRMNNILTALDDVDEFGDAIQELFETTKRSRRFGAAPGKATEDDVKKYLASSKGILESDKKRIISGIKLTKAELRRLQVIDSTNRVFKSVSDSVAGFSKALIIGVRDLRTNLKASTVLQGLQAPIAGALKGIVVPRLDLGKSLGDLSPFERVAKSLPEAMRSLSEMASLRTGAISLFQKLATETAKTDEVIKAGGAGVTPALLGLYKREVELKSSLRSAIEGVNNVMSPFIDAIRRMTLLETARKNIENLVLELRKMEELQFDTTSIDKALGRHPLSPTAAQFGQPAGLNKFQRQLFEITQKMQGPLTRQQYSQLQMEKKRIEFNQKESVIQYQQQKENAKLSREVQAAQKAMSILFDAQTKGIEGTQPLIDTLKSELASAGEVSFGPSGERFFKGIPSLTNLPRELARIQEQVRVKGLEQQKRVVMQPLIDLQGKANVLLKEIRDIQKARSKEVEKGKEPGTAGEEALKKVLDVTTKVFNDAASSTATELNKLAKSASDVAKVMDVVKKRAAGLFIEPRRGIPASTAKLVAPTPVQNKYSGGMVYGPAGIDNVRTNLTAGEYVVPRRAVSKIGKSNLDKAVRGYQEGGIVNLLTPEEEKFLAQQWADQNKKDRPRSKAQINALLLELGQFPWMGGTYSDVIGKTKNKELESYGGIKLTSTAEREKEIFAARAKMYEAQGKKVEFTKTGLKVSGGGYSAGPYEFKSKSELEKFKTAEKEEAAAKLLKERSKSLVEFNRIFGAYGNLVPKMSLDEFDAFLKKSSQFVPNIVKGGKYFETISSKTSLLGKRTIDFMQRFAKAGYEYRAGSKFHLKDYKDLREQLWNLKDSLSIHGGDWDTARIGGLVFSENMNNDVLMLAKVRAQLVNRLVKMLDISGGARRDRPTDIQNVLESWAKESGSISGFFSAAKEIRPEELTKGYGFLAKPLQYGAAFTSGFTGALTFLPKVAGKGLRTFQKKGLKEGYVENVGKLLEGAKALGYDLPKALARGEVEITGKTLAELAGIVVGGAIQMPGGAAKLADALKYANPRTLLKRLGELKKRALTATYPRYKPTIPPPAAKLEQAAMAGLRPKGAIPKGFVEPPTQRLLDVVAGKKPGALGEGAMGIPKKGPRTLVDVPVKKPAVVTPQVTPQAMPKGFREAETLIKRRAAVAAPREEIITPLARPGQPAAFRSEGTPTPMVRPRPIELEKLGMPTPATPKPTPLARPMPANKRIGLFDKPIASTPKPVPVEEPAFIWTSKDLLKLRKKAEELLGSKQVELSNRYFYTKKAQKRLVKIGSEEDLKRLAKAVGEQAVKDIPRYRILSRFLAKRRAVAQATKPFKGLLGGRTGVGFGETHGFVRPEYYSKVEEFFKPFNWLESKMSDIADMLVGVKAKRVVGMSPDSLLSDFAKRLREALGFAEGGFIKGPGTSTSDSIMTLLQPGSYVIKAASAKKMIPARVSAGEYVASPNQVKSMGGPSRMDYINKYGKLPGFQTGGYVPSRRATLGVPSAAPQTAANVNVDVSGIESKLATIVTTAFKEAAAAVRFDETSLSTAIENAFSAAGIEIKVSHDDLPKVKVDTTDLPEAIKVDTTEMESVLASIKQNLGNIGTGGTVGAAFRPDLEKVEGSIDVLRSEIQKMKKTVYVEHAGLFIDIGTHNASTVSKDDLSRELSAAETKTQVKLNEFTTDLNLRFSDVDVDNKVANAVDKKAAELDSKLSELRSIVNNTMTIAHQALSKTETRNV